MKLAAHMNQLKLSMVVIAFLASASLEVSAESRQLLPSPMTEETDPNKDAESAKKFREEVISETACDINGDGIPERIQIVLTSGRRYVDETLWCGQGETWEGLFVMRVRNRNGSVLRETPLNRLFHPESKESMPMSFWTPKFSLVMHDYNHDGRIDFNLGQYGCCVGNEYKLFTISRNGAVSVLPFDPKDSGKEETWLVSPGFLGAAGRHHDNSTTAVKRSGRFTVFSYFNRGLERHGMIVEKWKWVHGRFVRVSSELAE
jgi:hypothetical protein